MLICFTGAEDDAGLYHFVFGVQGNIAAVFSALVRRQGHILSGQDQAVSGEVLHCHAGSGAVAVAFRHGQEFPAVAGGRYYVGIRNRVNGNILPCGNIRFFA